MGEVIPLTRPHRSARYQHPVEVPTFDDIVFEDGELDWLAQRAGEIAHTRPFTESDFRGLVRALALRRAATDLVKISDTDGDLAVAVERRRQEILADLGV